MNLKWVLSVTHEFIKPLQAEDALHVLDALASLLAGEEPQDEGTSPAASMAIFALKTAKARADKKSADCAKGGLASGGNPALKKGKRSSAPKTDTSQEPEKPKQETVADKINAYTENTELRDALKAFSEMRTKQRKPLTPRAMALLLTALDSLSRNESEKVKIVNQSIVHGWQSVYALKPDYGTQRNDMRPGLRPAKELTDEDMQREYELGALNLDLLIKD